MKPDRAHEQNAREWTRQIVGVTLNGRGAIAVSLAAVAHALLDVAQAIREGHVRG